MIEAERIPSFAALSIAGSNAKPAMNSDIVNPIPVRKAPAATYGHDRPAPSVAKPERTASQLKAKTPIGLPSTKPTKTATETQCPKSAPSIVIPAFASAKIGMIAKPTQGWSMISSRSTGERDSATVILDKEARALAKLRTIKGGNQALESEH
jgi:hypothetical protein